MGKVVTDILKLREYNGTPAGTPPDGVEIYFDRQTNNIKAKLFTGDVVFLDRGGRGASATVSTSTNIIPGQIPVYNGAASIVGDSSFTWKQQDKVVHIGGVVQVENLPSHATPKAGMIAFDQGRFRAYNGTNWIAIDGSSSSDGVLQQTGTAATTSIVYNSELSSAVLDNSHTDGTYPDETVKLTKLLEM